VVFGTAGHVDHGKSTLVHALTGIDPDRLAEEKARSMTIDLGFAWLTLPSGRTASIVDVPGHERFIKNMLAGAGGIDAALLVIAADEGVMPQTAEHLAILDLLGIEHGLVAITKIDTVDADWLELVQAEIAERLAGSPFARAPVLLVSARTGAGLAELRAAMDRLADQLPVRVGGHQPRLPVDRVFTVAGFGTVVTGTLGGGELSIGQELRLFPGHRLVRVRGLQRHGQPVERAGAGSRVAINLAGVTVEQVRRGDVLAPAALLTPSLRLDARVHLLGTADWRLDQNSEVEFFTGAAELPARLTLLDRDVLDPGDDGWAQLRFREPVAVLKGDRFVLRRPSPSETIGGGEIIDPAPPRHKRFQSDVLSALSRLASGSPTDMLGTAIATKPLALPIEPTGTVAGLTVLQVETALAELLTSGEVVFIGAGPSAERSSGYVVTAAHRQRMLDAALSAIAAYHHRYPLRRGMPVQALRGQLDANPMLADAAIQSFDAGGSIVAEQTFVRLPSFQVSFTTTQQAAVDAFLAAFADQPYLPPSPATFGLDEELLAALEQLGQIVRVSSDVVLSPVILARMTDWTLATIDAAGAVSLAQLRDHFRTNRKVAQAVLEYLDRQRITRRIGDNRVRFAARGAANAGTAPEGNEP
jgi:selenocysteine-specific elongation factor